MVAVLAVGEVVFAEVRAAHDDFVVDAVEFHVLEAPAFVDAFGDVFFTDTGEVGCVVHAYLDSFCAEFCD